MCHKSVEENQQHTRFLVCLSVNKKFKKHKVWHHQKQAVNEITSIEFFYSSLQLLVVDFSFSGNNRVKGFIFIFIVSNWEIE